jgi:DNA-binding response OmpR family regulator
MVIKKDILLVDDDLDILDSITVILENSGYSVRTAINGQEALKALTARKPDLLLLDIMMTTDTEGFDLAFDLKNTPEFVNMPVIIMSSFLDKVRESGPESFQHILGEEWPAKWLFEKPVNTDKLLAKIEAIIGENRIS